MLISKKTVKLLNQQIGNEFGASLQYVAIANYWPSFFRCSPMKSVPMP
jgi:ferritin